MRQRGAGACRSPWGFALRRRARGFCHIPWYLCRVALPHARTAIALLVAHLLVACVLTTSLDGLTGSDEDAGAGDETKAPGGPNPEGGATDGGSGGGGDGGEGGGGDGSARFCADKSTLYLCADFDDDRFPLPFQLLLQPGGSAASPVTDNARSQPRAVLFALPMAAADVGATLTYPLAERTKDLTVEFDARVDQLGGVDYDILRLSAGGADVGFQINSDRSLAWDEAFADAGAGGVVQSMGRAFPADWAHLKLTIRVVDAIATAELFVDGASASTRAFRSDALTSSGSVMYFGDRLVRSLPTPWRVRLDNITVDRR